MITTRIALLLWALCLTPASADSVPLEERDWKLVTSENFRVHTVLDEDTTFNLLRRLEVMRSALDSDSQTATYKASIPTVILALDNKDDYVDVGAPGDTMGFFLGNLRENAIIMQSDDERGVQIMLHEYVHSLSRKRGRVNYPRWFEEGLAEYFSSSQVLDGQFQYGLPVERRRSALAFTAWLPSSTIIEVVDTSTLSDMQAEMFYGQSWLMVHYLYSQDNGEQETADKLQRYGELVSSGISKADAFEQAFPMTLKELDRALPTYLMAGEFRTYSIAANTALPRFQPRVESLSSGDMHLALAQMALRFGNNERAQQWFNAATREESSRAPAEAGLARILAERGNFNRAEQKFESAIAQMSWDFNIWMDYAQYWAYRISESYNHLERIQFAKKLEEALRSALTIKDATPELNSLMGFAYLAQGKDIAEAIDFLRSAAEQSPTDQSSRLLLASAYLLDGNFSAAIDTAESVLSLEHEPGEITSSAREIIDTAWEELQQE
ncbi:MAG: tetratricopeptide repeat protein [Gammaproteobacteria bacterium]|nr:tetratricopeptide repeat protein [Gammaproteobacteria bacterium]